MEKIVTLTLHYIKSVIGKLRHRAFTDTEIEVMMLYGPNDHMGRHF
jgi:hypothetical protein